MASLPTGGAAPAPPVPLEIAHLGTAPPFVPRADPPPPAESLGTVGRLGGWLRR
jgi:hypothetical protein